MASASSSPLQPTLNVIATPNGALRVPDSLGATLQFDRQLRPNLLLRLEYEHRQGDREFFINPVSPTAQQPAQLQLLDSGHQVYDEFLAMFRWQPTERISVVGSHVRSRAYGELNDFNQFFGNFPYPLIRSNQYGPLSSDAPNRVLFWGLIGLPTDSSLFQCSTPTPVSRTPISTKIGTISTRKTEPDE